MRGDARRGEDCNYWQTLASYQKHIKQLQKQSTETVQQAKITAVRLNLRMGSTSFTHTLTHTHSYTVTNTHIHTHTRQGCINYTALLLTLYMSNNNVWVQIKRIVTTPFAPCSPSTGHTEAAGCGPAAGKLISGDYLAPVWV